MGLAKDGYVYPFTLSTYSHEGSVSGVMIEASGASRELMAHIAKRAMREHLRLEMEIFGTLNGVGHPFIAVADDIIERWYFFERTGLAFPRTSYPLLYSVLKQLSCAKEETAPMWKSMVEEFLPKLPYLQ